MKNIPIIFAVILLALAGCSTIAPGSDPLVVRAEELAEKSTATVDAFLLFEYTHRLTLDHEVTRVADKIRREFPKAHDSLRVATKAYKNNRTPDRKFRLETAIALVESTTDIAAIYQP